MPEPEPATGPSSEAHPEQPVPLPVVRPAQAPWETGPQQPPAGHRPVTPTGTTEPPVPRRLVALDVEGDPSRDETAAQTDTTERR